MEQKVAVCFYNCAIISPPCFNHSPMEAGTMRWTMDYLSGTTGHAVMLVTYLRWQDSTVVLGTGYSTPRPWFRVPPDTLKRFQLKSLSPCGMHVTEIVFAWKLLHVWILVCVMCFYCTFIVSLLTRFSQETWLLEWGCRWQVGRQAGSNTIFVYDNLSFLWSINIKLCRWVDHIKTQVGIVFGVNWTVKSLPTCWK